LLLEARGLSTIARKAKGAILNIIGISAGYHDSACSLLVDGELIAAVQEERYSRLKNDPSLPRLSFRYCLREAKLSIADIDCVAFYEDPVLKLGRQVWMSIMPELSAGRRESLQQRLLGLSPQEAIRLTLGYEGPVEIVDHHLSHAASAYYFSGFDDAAILTVDGVGDWPTTTYSRASGATIERFESVDFPDSLGLFYSTITGYLGFEVNEGEYKIMGLAPYGKPLYADALRPLIQMGPAGQYKLDMRYFAYLYKDCMYSPEFVELLGRPPRQRESPVEQFHRDVARSAQVVLEEVLLEKVRYLHEQVPSENLCLSGGVALNVVANGRILREGPFKRLFVQPAAGDAGGSMGAAAAAHVRLTGQRPSETPLRSVFLGPQTSANEVYRILKGSTAQFQDFRGREPELLDCVVGHLAEGKVIGWLQGRCEFGPRALGARSILADPRVPDMRDRINASVKKRESFRPFAPSVMEEEQTRHFDLHHSSAFMLETCQVISPLELPAITHVDGSARVHTVNTEDNPRFWRLLNAFNQRTGCPILLNTSFNLRGEPIVNNAVDALACFVASEIDILVLEDFVLDRRSITTLWELMAQRRFAALEAAGEPVGHLVYTFF
jgi:carbamoyltransferase